MTEEWAAFLKKAKITKARLNKFNNGFPFNKQEAAIIREAYEQFGMTGDLLFKYLIAKTGIGSPCQITIERLEEIALYMLHRRTELAKLDAEWGTDL